jgi:O-antigen/teichoic acid export membrane protein
MKKAELLRGWLPTLLDKERHSVRILHNVGAHAVAQGINVLGQLLTVPIFLTYWGKELYGEWLLLSTLPFYFSMNDVGFADAGATEMTILVARNERATALEVFQSIWLLISVTSLLLLAVLAAVLLWAPVDNWLHITQMSPRESAIVLLLLLCQTVISQQISVLQAGFRCEGAAALGQSWNNVIRLAELVFMAGLVAGVSRPQTVVVATLLARLTGMVLMRMHLYRISPWLALGWQHARWAQIRRLAGAAFSFLALPLGNALKYQGIVLVVGVILGPVAVVAFTTVRTLALAAFQSMSIIHLSVWPEMSAAFGAGDLHLAKGLHRHSCRASFWLSLVSVMALFFLGGWIYRFWTHGQVELNQPLFYVLLLVIVANSLWYTSSMVPMAINRHQRTALWYLLGAGSAVALAAWLLPRWGLAGAGSALLVIDIVMLVHVLPQSLALVHDRFAEFILVVMKPPYRLAKLPERGA